MSFINRNQTKQLYYNINVVNKQDLPVVLNYSDIRAQNLLDNVDNYEMSILRFQLDLSEVPLMIFPNDTYDNFGIGSLETSTVDNTYYTITIEQYGPTTFFQQGVSYISFGRQSPYIYHFDDFCDMLNNAIKGAMLGLGIPDTVRPFFYYDKDSASINLALPSTFKSDSLPSYGLYVNKNLYNLFCKDYKGDITNLSDGRYYKISNDVLNNDYSATEVRVLGDVHTNSFNNGFLAKTYYPNLGNLVACKSIVFTTSQLPIVNEYISDNLDLSNDTSYSFTKIMKDFELSLEGTNSILSRGIQNFVIGSEFQMIQLKSGGESLNNIDLQGFWRDARGRLHQLLYPPASTFTMKLLFRRKN